MYRTKDEGRKKKLFNRSWGGERLVNTRVAGVTWIMQVPVRGLKGPASYDSYSAT